MPSVKKIETTSSDGKVLLRTESDGTVSVIDRASDPEADGEDAVSVPEASLIEAVLEYAHERGLRRSRKAKPVSGGARRRRVAAPAAEMASGNGAHA